MLLRDDKNDLLIDWFIDFSSISTHKGLFYA